MKVNTFSKLAIGMGVVALSVAGVVPAQADPSGPSSTALVGFGSDTTQDVMDEIASAIGGDKLASYKSIIGPGQTEYVQSRPEGPTNVIRAKGSGDGYRMLTVAEGSALTANVGTLANATLLQANKANAVGQIDYARSSGKQNTASLTGEYVNVPFAIDSMGIAVNPQDAVAKIPLEGLGTTGDAATKATVMSIWRCQARYVYITNISLGAATVANTGVITKATHGLVAGDRVTFSGTLPTGLDSAVNYYVKTVPTTSTFTVAATKTGSAVITGAGSVTITKTMSAANAYHSVGAAPTVDAPAPAGTTGYVISPLIPVFGSGTGAYFVGKIGRTEAAGFPASGDAGQNCISRKALDGTTNIQEHEGYGVAERENSMVGYSIGQWASQTNSAITGVTNRTSGTVMLDFFPKAGGDTSVAAGVFTSTAHGLVVGNQVTFRSTGTLPAGITAGTKYFVRTAPTVSTFTISATSGGAQITPAATPAATGVLSTFKVLNPFVGSGATLAPNEGWTSDLQRVVYNVMPYRKAANPSHPLNEMFVGTGSLVCQQRDAILKMGFTPLSSTDPTNANSCGSIVNANRSTAGGGGSVVTGASIAAFASSSAEVGIAKSTTVKIGTSNHQMGGTVQVLDAAIGTAGAKVLGSVNVAADVSGTTETNIDVIITKPGSTTLYAYFIPALGAIQVTPLLWGGVADATTTTLTASAGEADVSLSIRKPSGIGGTGRAIAIVQAPVAPGGTVELFKTGDDQRSTSGVVSDTRIEFALKSPAVANVFNAAGTTTLHGLVAGNPVKFSGANCPVAVRTAGATYFVSATGLTTTAFRVATTATGAALATAAGVVDCTVTKVTPTVFTATAHGLAVGNRVAFTSGTLPTGFVVDTNYFVKTAPTANTFTLAATNAATAPGIVATANGSDTYALLNTTPLASGTLSEGETAELLSYTQSTASMSIYARYVSADGSLTPSNSRNVVVSVPKLTATLASTLPAAPNGFTAGTAPAFANTVQNVRVGTANATLSYTNDTFAIASHGLTAGTRVTFTATTLPAGITAKTPYYVISDGLTTGAFKVSATVNGSAVDLGTRVSESTLTVNSAGTAGTATADTFTSTTAHSLTAGTIVQFAGTTLPAGITAGTNYFVLGEGTGGLTSTVFKVSATLNGTAVNMTSNGSAVSAFTGGGVAVTVFKANLAPRVTLTATGQSGASAKPSGTIRVYIGASPVDRSREIQITGAQLAAAATGAVGSATATLTQSALWAGLGSVPTAGRNMFLIIDYSGDGVYGATSLNKQIRVTPGS